MQWYYSKNGTQLGPVGQGELIAKLASGEVSASDLVWKDGMADWIPASQVAELRSAVATPATPVSAAPPFSSPGSPPSPYAAPSSQVAGGGNPNQEIPNYLWQSIVVTIFCCWPLGIPAIIFAAKVDGLKARGDIAGAQAAAANAKKWTLIAMISGLVAIGIYIVVMVFGIMSGGMTPPA